MSGPHVHFGVHALDDLWRVLGEIGAAADAALNQARLLHD